MYRARDRLANSEWLAKVAAAGERIGLAPETIGVAEELFLADVPETAASKRVAVAASLYAAGRIEGEKRSQAAVAEAVGVARLSVHNHWRDRLTAAGVVPPEW